MAETNTRIEQFKKMAEADPENVLGHFSLGRAYLESGMNAEAAAAFERALQLDSKLSKAYQLLADALLKQGQRNAAIDRLTQGVKIADDRGDIMPKNDMIKSLQDLGAPIPELKQSTQQQTAGEGEVLCRRCGQIKKKMAS